MSQKAVFDLLKELGGKAKTGEVAKLAKEKYPDASLYQYVSDRLRKLQNWGYVRHNPDGTWEIVSKKGPIS